MAIRITCPGCKTILTLDDDVRGQKVRCDNCDKALSIPAASGAKREKEMAVQNGQKTKIKAKSVPAPAEDDVDDEEESPKKKKKHKKPTGAGAMTWVLVGGAAVFVLTIVGVGVWALTLPRKTPPAPVQEAKAPPEEPEKPRSGTRIIIPRREDGNPANTKKGGKGIVNSVRGAGYRTERRAELKSIGLSFNQFCDEYKGGARTLDNFLQYIKQQGPIYEAVKDGYYQINMRARQSGNSVIAYERDIDNQGHLAVRGDTSVDYVSAADLKAALGN